MATPTPSKYELRKMLFQFYQENDPDIVAKGFNINGLVDFTAKKGIDVLNLMLLKKYGKKLEVTLERPFENMTDIEVKAELTAFYKLHDPDDLLRIDEVLELARKLGRERLNKQLIQIYNAILVPLPKNWNKNEIRRQKTILLRKLISDLKENGVENEKDQLVVNEKTLQRLSELSKIQFKDVLKFGIEIFCLKRETMKGKVRIVLVSEEIDEDEEEDEEVDKYAKEKKNAQQIFKIIKEKGFESENGDSVCREMTVRRNLFLKKTEYENTLEFCKAQGCLRTYTSSKNETFIVLMKETFSSTIEPSKKIVNLLLKVVDLLKKSKEETEEGYLFMTVESCIELLRISPGKLRKVVKYGLKEDTLKFEEVKDVKIVVYTKERRLDTRHL